MVKIDPYNIKEKYAKWKTLALINDIPGVTTSNSQIIMQYLKDMEQGLNVATSNKKAEEVRLESIESIKYRVT